jgi:hypothetical protein
MRRAPTAITLHALRRDGTRNEAFQGIIALEGFYRRDPENPTVRIPIAQAKFAEGEAVLEKAMVTRVPPAAQGERLEALILPGWVSLLPPILAIALAIAFRQVIMALAFGIYLGAFFVEGFDPFQALLRVAEWRTSTCSTPLPTIPATSTLSFSLS